MNDWKGGRNKLRLAGQRFGRLLILAEAPRCMWTRPGRSTWIAACDCGGFKTVSSDYLKYGATRSCGCQFIDRMKYNNPQRKVRRRGTGRAAANDVADVADYFFGKAA